MGMCVPSIQPNTSRKISYGVKFGFFPLQHDFVAQRQGVILRRLLMFLNLISSAIANFASACKYLFKIFLCLALCSSLV